MENRNKSRNYTMRRVLPEDVNQIDPVLTDKNFAEVVKI